MAVDVSNRAVVECLAAAFHRNGYVRRVNDRRRQVEGPLYKKGDEVRLVAQSPTELAAFRRWLWTAGFPPGRPFRKHRQYIQPLYGRREVARFLELVGAAVDT